MEIGSIRNISQLYGSNNVINNRNENQKNPAEIPQESISTVPEIDDGSKVIGTSSDGDTAKASEEALEGLKDGIVLPRMAEAAQTQEKEEIEPEDSESAGSLTGYTSAELSRLQSTGEITRNEYDREIERREKLRGTEEDDNKAEELALSGGVNPAVSGQDSDINAANITGTSKDANTQSTATATGANNDTEAEEKSAEVRKEIISEEIDRENELSKRMNNLATEGENITLQVGGMQQALANGREDIVSQIFEEGLIKNINQI